jgi:hypothetical protein
MDEVRKTEKALNNFFETKIGTVPVIGWKTIASTYHEATRKILTSLIEKGLIKDKNLESFFFGDDDDDEYFDEYLNSEKDNLIIFKEVKMVAWRSHQPSVMYFDYPSPEYRHLDLFSFLYIYLENPNLFEGIKELPTFYETNYFSFFFPIKKGEARAKRFVIAWDWDSGKTWASLQECETNKYGRLAGEAHTIMVTVG